MKPIRDVHVRKIETVPGWKKALKFISALVVIVAVWAVTMNVIVNYVLPTKITTANTTSGGLYYQLGIDKTFYRAGEPIQLQLSVRNTSDQPVALRFATSHRCNFVVKRDVDFLLFHFPVDVWQSSYQDIPRPDPNVLTLKPGETMVFKGTWNQEDATGKQVPTGRYLIAASLTNAGSKTILELPAHMQR